MSQIAVGKKAPDKREAVAAILGCPVWGDLPETVRKVRRNLVAFGVIAIVMDVAKVGIDPAGPVFGFHLTGLNDGFIQFGLLLILLYQLLHFSWYALETLVHWRLRVTGTLASEQLRKTTFGPDGADYPLDPQQSTLYNWWREEARKVGDLAAKAKDFEEWFHKARQEFLQFAGPTPIADHTAVIGALNALRGYTDTLQRAVEEARATLASERIPASLENFDNWFRLLLRSENARWLFVEILMPIAIGLAGVALLLL